MSTVYSAQVGERVTLYSHSTPVKSKQVDIVTIAFLLSTSASLGYNVLLNTTLC